MEVDFQPLWSDIREAPVVHGIKCSVVMKPNLTNEAEVAISPSYSCSAPDSVTLFCLEITLFGGIVSLAVSGSVSAHSVVNGHV